MSLESGRLIDAEVPPEVRQERIAGLVQDNGFVRVVDLAARFQVSTVTIRSDLQALEARGPLHRIRGGAVPANVTPGEQPFEAAALDLATEKARIGTQAARLVASGETVLLDVGTTTTAVARALIARTDLRDVTVLLSTLNASICFIGCNGVDVRGGITNINLPEAEIKRAMLLAARRRVIVADGSKLGEVELAKVCDIDEISLVITDRTADPAVVSEIETAGCAVELAP